MLHTQRAPTKKKHQLSVWTQWTDLLTTKKKTAEERHTPSMGFAHWTKSLIGKREKAKTQRKKAARDETRKTFWWLTKSFHFYIFLCVMSNVCAGGNQRMVRALSATSDVRESTRLVKKCWIGKIIRFIIQRFEQQREKADLHFFHRIFSPAPSTRLNDMWADWERGEREFKTNSTIMEKFLLLYQRRIFDGRTRHCFYFCVKPFPIAWNICCVSFSLLLPVRRKRSKHQ